jgi:hypothetical protein
MSEHVLTVLRAKRNDVSEQVKAAEKKLTILRAALANLDAAMAILTPDHPEHIPNRKKYRTGYFGRNELPRLVRDALRGASAPMTTSGVAAACIKAKSLPASAYEQAQVSVLGVLRGLARRGDVARSGTTRDSKWAVLV